MLLAVRLLNYGSELMFCRQLAAATAGLVVDDSQLKSQSSLTLVEKDVTVRCSLEVVFCGRPCNKIPVISICTSAADS